jgi:hemerythrin
MLELDPILLTGIDDIDAQHRELFGRIRALLEASQKRRSRQEVIGLLEFLGSYVVDHFDLEDRMMREVDYPGIDGHRAEHRQFIKELEVLRHELKSEGPSSLFAIRVGNRVTAYLREHIYRTDRMLASWLRANRPGT